MLYHVFGGKTRSQARANTLRPASPSHSVPLACGSTKALLTAAQTSAPARRCGATTAAR